MEPADFAKLERLFAELCDAPADARAAALAKLAAESPELARALGRMLERDAKPASTRLDAAERGLGRVAAAALDEALPPPDQIGGFRIDGLLGRGGMGTVYRAEQQRPRRMVALKVLQPGMASASSLRRFALEAELLGRLQHPNIAQIHDAGMAELHGSTQPWFAMELVDGVPLTVFGRAAGRTLRERILLLAKVAEAVHHAHQKGIVHRDLKPANVLVTAGGEPKVLDFGVARVIDADAATRATEAGLLVGTLAFMSPEQVTGTQDAIDTRSDVYALGVLAYELLSGRMPYALEELPLPEAARRIAEVDPPRLGTLDPALRGDLETIVARALAKEPARRYPSAQEFADDLRRHLDDQPITARPPSAAYQLAKFARRHRGLVAGAALAVVALAGAAAGISAFAVQARARARTATTVAMLLDEVISAPDPWSTDSVGHRDVRVVDALKQAERGLAESFHGEAAVEAFVRSTLGRTYLNLGELALARRHLERAVELLPTTDGRDAERTLRAEANLASVEIQSGALDVAERRLRDVLARATAALGPAATVTLDAAAQLVHVLRDSERLDDARTLATRNRDVAQAALGADAPATLKAEHNLAGILLAAGDLRGAETMLRELLPRRRRVEGEDHPLTLTTEATLGECLWRQGRAAEAEPISRAHHDALLRLLGPDHPRTLLAAHGLAAILTSLGRHDEALALRDQLLVDSRRVFGPDHLTTLRFTFDRVFLLHSMQRLKEAESACRELIERERVAAPEALDDALNLLATICVDTGRPAEALPLFEEALDRTALPERHWRRALFRANYGNALRLAGKTDEAEGELVESVEDLEAALGLAHDDTQYALAKLVALYDAIGDKEKAATARARLTPTGRMHAR